MAECKIQTRLNIEPVSTQKPEDESTPRQQENDTDVKAELNIRQEEANSLKDNREMRKNYAEKSYKIAFYTVIFWGVLFFLYFGYPPNEKPISEIALGIFTTACTVNVLAAYISIVKGLFAPNNN